LIIIDNVRPGEMFCSSEDIRCHACDCRKSAQSN